MFRFSGEIASKQITKIRYFNFCGHVYNLQSDPYNLYAVNGIITHNCRCWMTVSTKI
jgi:intein/homing endonuclease